MKTSFPTVTNFRLFSALVTLGFVGVSTQGYSATPASAPAKSAPAPVSKVEKNDFTACTNTTYLVKARAVTRDEAVAQCSVLKASQESPLDWCMWGEEVLLESHHITTGWCD